MFVCFFFLRKFCFLYVSSLVIQVLLFDIDTLTVIKELNIKGYIAKFNRGMDDASFSINSRKNGIT